MQLTGFTNLNEDLIKNLPSPMREELIIIGGLH